MIQWTGRRSDCRFVGHIDKGLSAEVRASCSLSAELENAVTWQPKAAANCSAR